MVKLAQLSSVERRTFYLHFAYSVIDGLLGGIIALNEFILLKSLSGNKYQLGLMYQLPQMVLLFAVILNEIIRRTRHKKRFIFWYVAFTRIVLLLVLFIPTDLNKITPFDQYLFLSILLIYYMSMPVMFPTITLFLRNTYNSDNFGKLYSYATTAGKIAIVLATFITGMLLDHNRSFFRYLYVFMAFAGVISIIIFSLIPYEDKQYEDKATLFDSVKKSYLRMKNIVTANKPFLHYQIAFMLYGIAYMTTDSVIPLFLKDVFKLNYSSLAFYKNSFNIINISLLPLFGHMIHKIDPRRFSAWSFFALALSMLFFVVSWYNRQYVEIWHIQLYFMLLVAYIFYGIFSATMALAWYIGPAYFCSYNEAGDYQSVHLMFTGIRGMFAPVLGIVLYSFIGFRGVFINAIVFLLIAIGVMFISNKKEKMVQPVIVE